MELKIFSAALIALLTISFGSAQVTPGLQDKIDQKPNTSKVDVIIMNQPNANERAKQAVKNANGNISHDFNIIDGVAVTIPKVAAENLANRDFVREIQPDYKVETKLSDSTSTVNAEDVWSNSTGEGVDVAVLDTGIEDNTILNVEDQVDYTGEGTDDLNGHGTHVAGIVASPDNQYKGVAHGADLYDIKVLGGDGSGSASDVISGLEYAAENNLEVATLSLGAKVSECDGTSSLSEAVDNTVEQGVTVTVAAGNQGPDSETITAPGCAEKPITVGSSGNGEISSFSGRGPTADGRTKPDLVAPGETITSLTNNNGDSPQFETLSGTSMATPHVAGTAALLLAEKDLTPAEVKNITTSTAEDLGISENSQGSGRLDAYAAFQQIATKENKTKNKPPKVEALETQVTLLNESAEATLTVNTTDSNNETVNVGFYIDGEQASRQEGIGVIKHTETNLSLNTNYSWKAEAKDGINTSQTETQNFSTATKEEKNQPPTIEAVNTDVTLGNETASATLTINATDPDNNKLNYTFNIDGEKVTSSQGYGEITHTETNLSLDRNYTWTGETNDGTNTSTTQTIEFNTVKQKEEENQTREENQTKPELPPQASDTAKKARMGFFNPTSPFYGFDVAFDRATVALGIRSKESVLEERKTEAKNMLEKGNTNAAKKAVKKLRNSAGNTETSGTEAEKPLNKGTENSSSKPQKSLQELLKNEEKERKKGKPKKKKRTNKGSKNSKNEKSSLIQDKEENKSDSKKKQTPQNKGNQKQGRNTGQKNKQEEKTREKEQRKPSNLLEEENSSKQSDKGQNQGRSDNLKDNFKQDSQGKNKEEKTQEQKSNGPNKENQANKKQKPVDNSQKLEEKLNKGETKTEAEAGAEADAETNQGTGANAEANAKTSSSSQSSTENPGNAGSSEEKSGSSNSQSDNKDSGNNGGNSQGSGSSNAGGKGNPGLGR